MSSGRFVVHLPVRVANLAAARRFARTLTRALSFFPNLEAAGTTGWNELRYAGVSGAVEGTGCGVSCGVGGRRHGRVRDRHRDGSGGGGGGRRRGGGVATLAPGLSRWATPCRLLVCFRHIARG